MARSYFTGYPLFRTIQYKHTQKFLVFVMCNICTRRISLYNVLASRVERLLVLIPCRVRQQGRVAAQLKPRALNGGGLQSSVAAQRSLIIQGRSRVCLLARLAGQSSAQDCCWGAGGLQTSPPPAQGSPPHVCKQHLER